REGEIRMKKSIFLLLVGVHLIFGFSTQASADNQSTWFATEEDSRWNMTLKITGKEKDMQINLEDLWKVNKATGESLYYASDFLPLDGRLCKASTGACTPYESFHDDNFGTIEFTNMKPGTYYLEIIDWEPEYTYQGYVSGKVE